VEAAAARHRDGRGQCGVEQGIEVDRPFLDAAVDNLGRGKGVAQFAQDGGVVGEDLFGFARQAQAQRGREARRRVELRRRLSYRRKRGDPGGIA
jgi:hypothetical protein